MCDGIVGLCLRVCARLWFEWQFTGCIVADCGLMRARNEADMRNKTPACVRPRVRTRPMCAVVRTCGTCLLRACVWRLCEAATNGTTCGTSSFAHTARAVRRCHRRIRVAHLLRHDCGVDSQPMLHVPALSMRVQHCTQCYISFSEPRHNCVTCV